MKHKTESHFAAEQLAARANWLLLIGAGVLSYGHINSRGAIVGTVLLTVLNILAYRSAGNAETYAAGGRQLCSAVRFCQALLFAAAPAAHLWVLAIPAIALEAFVSRSAKLVAFFTLAAMLATLSPLALGGHLSLSTAFPPLVTGGAVTVLFGIMEYVNRGEELYSTSHRLNSVFGCGLDLAESCDLDLTIQGTLRAAVQETNATCGYVMLLDDQNKDLLVTEAAYGSEGEFEFPQKILVGDGMSGYVAKVGQPISVSGAGSQHQDFDGVTTGVKSAASIPLVIRSFTSGGQAAVDQVLGVMTLLNLKKSESFGDQDMELLRTLGSLISVAVSSARMEERRRTTFLLTMESLATALEARDEYTRGHSQRVCEVSLMIGERLGLGADAIEELRIGTILHDIGKIGVPDEILNKRGRLTDDEFVVMKSHPVIGYEICKPLMLSEGVLMIIRNHHEKLDGSGYPDGLKGGELPLSLRIVCVADAFDAMSSKRPYRSVMDTSTVLAELSKGAGTQFDPVVVESLKALMVTERLRDLYRQYWGDVELKVA